MKRMFAKQMDDHVARRGMACIHAFARRMANKFFIVPDGNGRAVNFGVPAETDDFVAVATEEIAIRSAIPGDYKVSEAQVEEVRVWSR